MHNEKVIAQLKEENKQTLALGRTTIIKTAAAVITNDIESMIDDPYVYISVWYNDTRVKVHFIEHVPIKFISSKEPSYYTEVEVFVSAKRGVHLISGSYVPEFEDDNSSAHFGGAHLYRTSKDKEMVIDSVIKLNNDCNEYRLSKDFYNLIIKEQERHYGIRIGGEYPITYKIDKDTGAMFDYEDPYKFLYVTPAEPPEDIVPEGEVWKELK